MQNVDLRRRFAGTQEATASGEHDSGGADKRGTAKIAEGHVAHWGVYPLRRSPKRSLVGSRSRPLESLVRLCASVRTCSDSWPRSAPLTAVSASSARRLTFVTAVLALPSV